eukprot:scaffold2527_cov185-Skeletonema_menzelii.AAC.1
MKLLMPFLAMIDNSGGQTQIAYALSRNDRQFRRTNNCVASTASAILIWMMVCPFSALGGEAP